MENDIVVTGLLRRRQQIADELEIAQGRMRQLVMDLDALDVSIRLFRPDIEIDLVRIKPLARRHAAIRGEATKMILGALREAEKPLTVREIARSVMQARGMNLQDEPIAKTMRERVATSVRKMALRNKLVSDDGVGLGRRWNVV